MAGSSHWIILYDKTSGQVTRRVWDDEKELTLQHPAAVLGPNEASFLYPTTSFLASVVSGGAYAYPVEVDPTLMTAVAKHAQVAANAIAFANALFYFGLKYRNAQNTGIFQYVNPVATFISAWIILGEGPNERLIAGSILIVIGIYFAEKNAFHKLKLVRLVR